jgi:hypothetical protein
MLGVCEIFYGEPKNLPERCNKILTYFDFTPWFAKKLAPDEAYTIHLDELLNVRGGKFGAADISIKMNTILGFSPFGRSDGNYHLDIVGAMCCNVSIQGDNHGRRPFQSNFHRRKQGTRMA